MSKKELASDNSDKKALDEMEGKESKSVSTPSQMRSKEKVKDHLKINDILGIGSFGCKHGRGNFRKILYRDCTHRWRYILEHWHSVYGSVFPDGKESTVKKIQEIDPKKMLIVYRDDSKFGIGRGDVSFYLRYLLFLPSTDYEYCAVVARKPFETKFLNGVSESLKRSMKLISMGDSGQRKEAEEEDEGEEEEEEEAYEQQKNTSNEIRNSNGSIIEFEVWNLGGEDWNKRIPTRIREMLDSKKSEGVEQDRQLRKVIGIKTSSSNTASKDVGKDRKPYRNLFPLEKDGFPLKDLLNCGDQADTVNFGCLPTRLGFDFRSDDELEKINEIDYLKFMNSCGEVYKFNEFTLSPTTDNRENVIIGVCLKTESNMKIPGENEKSYNGNDVKNLFEGFMEPLRKYPNVKLISLHRGHRDEEKQIKGLIHFDKALGDSGFEHSMNLIRYCDFVVSNDTAICHIAAAMGVITLTLLPPLEWVRKYDLFRFRYPFRELPSNDRYFQSLNYKKMTCYLGVAGKKTDKIREYEENHRYDLKENNDPSLFENRDFLCCPDLAIRIKELIERKINGFEWDDDFVLSKPISKPNVKSTVYFPFLGSSETFFGEKPRHIAVEIPFVRSKSLKTKGIDPETCDHFEIETDNWVKTMYGRSEQFMFNEELGITIETEFSIGKDTVLAEGKDKSHHNVIVSNGHGPESGIEVRIQYSKDILDEGVPTPTLSVTCGVERKDDSRSDKKEKTDEKDEGLYPEFEVPKTVNVLERQEVLYNFVLVIPPVSEEKWVARVFLYRKCESRGFSRLHTDEFDLSGFKRIINKDGKYDDSYAVSKGKYFGIGVCPGWGEKEMKKRAFGGTIGDVRVTQGVLEEDEFMMNFKTKILREKHSYELVGGNDTIISSHEDAVEKLKDKKEYKKVLNRLSYSFFEKSEFLYMWKHVFDGNQEEVLEWCVERYGMKKTEDQKVDEEWESIARQHLSCRVQLEAVKSLPRSMIRSNYIPRVRWNSKKKNDSTKIDLLKKELENIDISNFGREECQVKVCRKLGKGCFGFAFLCYISGFNGLFVAKIIPSQDVRSDRKIDNETLGLIHPCISPVLSVKKGVKMVKDRKLICDFFYNLKDFWEYLNYLGRVGVVLMRYHRTSLKNIIDLSKKNGIRWSTPEFFDIFQGILEGAKILHRNQIVHRDLHSGNIFIDPDNREVVVGDFGCAINLKSRSPTNILSTNPFLVHEDDEVLKMCLSYSISHVSQAFDKRGYPEIRPYEIKNFNEQKKTNPQNKWLDYEKHDVYSIGVLGREFLRRIDWETMNENELKTSGYRVEKPRKAFETLEGLVEKMTAKRKIERCSIEEACQQMKDIMSFLYNEEG